MDVQTALDAQAQTGEPSESRFVGGPPRETTVDLTYPIEFQGVLYERITIRRVTSREIYAYAQTLTAIEESKTDERVPLPTIRHPQALLDCLDLDDMDRVTKVATDFLPERLRPIVST